MGSFWANNIVLTLVCCGFVVLALLASCFSTIKSTPFPTDDWAVGLTWFGWAAYLMVALGFAIGPDHLARWWMKHVMLRWWTSSTVSAETKA